jgi:hypothetical protein
LASIGTKLQQASGAQVKSLLNVDELGMRLVVDSCGAQSAYASKLTPNGLQIALPPPLLEVDLRGCILIEEDKMQSDVIIIEAGEIKTREAQAATGAQQLRVRLLALKYVVSALYGGASTTYKSRGKIYFPYMSRTAVPKEAIYAAGRGYLSA